MTASVEANPAAVSPASALQPPIFVDTDRRAKILAACHVVDTVFQRYAVQGSAPGIAYGVILDGELLHTGSLGVANIARQTPVGPATRFRIASVTKSFLAAAVLHLCDRGLLRLDAPAADYAPDMQRLPYPTHDAAPITVRDLLTMAVGWPEDNAWGDRQLALLDGELDALVRQGVTFANAPGIAFEYSNLAYMVLGRIVHQAAGVSALRYITEHILRPLGMTDTDWNGDPAQEPQVAAGYRWEDHAWHLEPVLPSHGDAAAFGGLLSTVQDLARWVAFFLDAWPPRNEPEAGPLRRSSCREMQQAWRTNGLTTHQPSLGAPAQVLSNSYGFGLSVVNDGRLRIVGHAGGLPGFGSHMAWLPDHGVGIVALANATYAPMRPAADEALRQLLQASHAPARRVLPAPALLAAQAAINQLIARWDDPLADTLFADNFFLDLDRDRWRDSIGGPHRQTWGFACGRGNPGDKLAPWALAAGRGTRLVLALDHPYACGAAARPGA